MAERTVIYYYTGSGNTLSVSNKIAEVLGYTDVCSIYSLKNNACIPDKYDRVGIATATWFIRPPRIVKEICEKMQLNPSQKVFIIATCGGYDGFVLIDLKAILQAKVNAPIQTFMLPMPPNHIVGFSPMPDGIVKIYLNHEKKATKKIVKAIQSEKRTKDRKGRGRKAWNWCSRTFNLHLGVDRDSTEGGFYTTDACIHCGICEKICQAGNIHLSENGVEWGHDCQQCMACIMWCPHKAIWHPNVPKNRRRYHHPDVTLSDMIHSGEGTDK
ncbi:MAG: EFR1 family ferrodoxin [Erysipelotrichaceae bacterium]|nr:EFR1 family ferrodoxin [Erysipelotrichaceae bacterium]